MRIINNKIYIFRGETPTYNASFIIKETGAPYILLDSYSNPHIEFTVRKSLYATDDSYGMRVFLDLATIHSFPTTEIASYAEPDWNDAVGPTEGNELKLHRKTTGVTDLYRYYDDDKWIPYEFSISFPFVRTATANLEPKTYQYEIALIAGTDPVQGEIDYKEVLLPPNDFVVEGSVSE